jgi:putative oxidoreductase
LDVVILIGRLLFVPVFLSSGIMAHFVGAKQGIAYAQSKGVPAPALAVSGGGVLLVLGGVSVLLGIWPDLGALLLVIFLVPTALLMHGFWRETDPQARYMEQIQFSKDLGLAGASLMLFALFAQRGEELRYVLVGPLFD